MDKSYNPKDYEEKIYSLWEKSGAFTPKIDKKKKPFTIVLPPPNANAPLHLGHAMYSIEDVLVRYHRMLGDPTLWLPGADHAGFETQVVYEKHLAKEGKSRFDFDRETLYKNIWDFVQGNKTTMENQLKKLGFSIDWSREKFTLDPDVVKLTQSTFKKLYDDGLVYRENRLVNYCTKHGTAFSDLEIEHVEKDDFLYYVKFTIKDMSDLVVATSRPETLAGDTALAVNPTDKRYKKYIGKTTTNLITGKVIPIISDEKVDKRFGTGVLKVTPAHDANDFEISKTHNLPLIQVIDFRGKLNENNGAYKGLKVLDAREKILEFLRTNKELEKTVAYKHTVGTCYKCGTVLEPLPLPQWYIKTDSLAKKAIEVVKKGEIKIIPKRFEKIYFQWLENIHDWNISRQVVWGIRIPAWLCKKCNSWTVTNGEIPIKCSNCKNSQIEQDVDNFDTWFSSGQWPFATLGYPNKEDYEYFYPTSVMETGYDILFFWVARMIMLGIYVTGKIPFEAVYLHGLVRDSKGQKMSKSKGNVINPMDIIEKFGADALRMSLIAGTGAGNDQNFTESKIIGYRNFANKIWNAARYIEMLQSGETFTLDKSKKEINIPDRNKEFEKEIKKIVTDFNKLMQGFQINLAAELAYEKFWHWYCDEMIEANKAGSLSKETLKKGMVIFLKLLHPFMPFVTEAIWQENEFLRDNPLLINASWPK